LDKILNLSPAPELVVGFVAPIGVDLDLVVNVFEQTLQEVRYEPKVLRLTELMKEVHVARLRDATHYLEVVQQKIDYANERLRLGDEALAALAISAIRSYRAEEWKRREEEARSKGVEVVRPDDTAVEETPLPHQAYLLRQFKRPEEIALLRSVYGRQFIVVSAYAAPDDRIRHIQDKERRSRGGLVDETQLHQDAYALIAQDAKEKQEAHGQNVRDAFPLGDVFIDATTRDACETTLRRFVRLLFGNNRITPTHDEYGMYLAKSTSLRSSDLSRQVGAAIFQPTGEVITLGCNEVPKAGGGTYWTGDPVDKRDFVEGFDPNDQRKTELLADVIDRLKKSKHLSDELLSMDDPYEICKTLLEERGDNSIRESEIMDILEFGRIIHAEMSAISDAARKGLAVQNAILYCTTFPCHICAKHIVAAGITRVVFLEPYPKSYAFQLHRDSIDVEPKSSSGKVSFNAFIGVSPFRYRDLFEKGKRKYSGGLAQEWHQDVVRPMIEVYHPSYFVAEALVVDRVLKPSSTAEGSAAISTELTLSGDSAGENRP
jgi:deoxycytidylate deaminase